MIKVTASDMTQFQSCKDNSACAGPFPLGSGLPTNILTACEDVVRSAREVRLTRVILDRALAQGPESKRILECRRSKEFLEAWEAIQCDASSWPSRLDGRCFALHIGNAFSFGILPHDRDCRGSQSLFGSIETLFSRGLRPFPAGPTRWLETRERTSLLDDD
jgi:hypothetical protein